MVWFQPNDPIATALLHLALARFVHGDLTGAEAELAQVAHRVEGLGFPQGPFSAAFARFVEIWLRIEAGQLDRAAVLAADLIEPAERHGFDAWQLWGGTQQATVGALVALGAEDLDPTALPSSHRDHDHVRRRLSQGRAERLPHLLRQCARAAVARRRATRPGPRPPRRRTGAGPRHRDVLL